MLVDKKKEWSSYKMEVVIRKGERKLLWKLIGKGSSYKGSNYQIVRLENELLFFNCIWNGTKTAIQLQWSCRSNIRNFLQITPYKLVPTSIEFVKTKMNNNLSPNLNLFSFMNSFQPFPIRGIKILPCLPFTHFVVALMFLIFVHSHSLSTNIYMRVHVLCWRIESNNPLA
jgi:hypothetical protein